MKRVLIAANPRSGRGQGQKLLTESRAALTAAGYQVEAIVSQFDGHLLHVLPQQLQQQWDLVVALGGDGTLFQVVNCCMRQPDFDATIGLIPAGTGNTFSREFHLNSWKPWQRILAGKPAPVDLIRCRLEQAIPVYGREFFFLTATGFGFVSNATVAAVRYKRLGVAAYAVAVLRTLIKFDIGTFVLELDGRKFSSEAVFLIVANSRYIGGNMLISPRASVTDGRLEVLLLKRVDRWEFLKTFPKVFDGSHLNHPSFEVRQGTRLRLHAEPPQIATPDGEVIGRTPLEFEVLPQRLQFIL